jgi:tetratricopeptide (TPR) repeat protein
MAQYQMLADFDAESAARALELAEALGLDEQRAQLLITIGSARWFRGDRDGRDDIHRGLQIALSGNYLQTARRAYINLSACAEKEGDLHDALRLVHEAQTVDERLGATDSLRWDGATATYVLFELGEWDQCGPAADEFLTESERRPNYMDSWVRLVRARLRLALGDVNGALEDQAAGLSAARLAKDPQMVHPAVVVSAYLLVEAGLEEQGGQLLDEVMLNDARTIGDLLAGMVIDLAVVADRLGRREEVGQWLAASGDSKWLQAARAMLEHDFEHALEVLETIRAIRAWSVARLWAARVLAANGRYRQAEATLEPALHFFRSVGAVGLIREATTLTESPDQATSA